MTKKLWIRCFSLLLVGCLFLGLSPAAIHATVTADPPAVAALGENIIYGTAGETTYVPAGYTYVYEGPDGQTYYQEAAQDTYISTRVLTPEEAEALANLEYGESYMVNADGQNLLCKEFNAQEAAAYSNAVQAILDGVELKETDNVSVLCEAYTSQAPVRALITFEDAPVIRMESMSVSLGNGLGEAELQAARAIEDRQTSIMARAEKSLGYEIQVHGQFSLLTNAVAATVNYGDLAKLSKLEGIKSAILMPSYSVPELETQVVDEDFVLEPNMKYAGPGMGANAAWDVGYKGEGMSVAILDTGLSYMNPSFAIEPSDPDTVAYTKDEIAGILASTELNAETLSADTSIDTVYYSPKIPFGFDYGDSVANFGEDTAWHGHGSHVAGIVAGNLPENVQKQFEMETLGIAPEAQLIIMKVFDMMGQGYLDYIIAAMEDAIALGVDCANLSLGVPSGPYYLEGFTELFDAAYEAGINIVAAAGNDAHSGANSLWGDNMVKSDSVSTGTLGMPGTFDSVLTVASVNNSHQFNTRNNAFIWYDAKQNMTQSMGYRELPDVPAGKGFTENLKGRVFDFTDSFEDAEGKLVACPFDSGNADSIIQEAAQAGAAGLILLSFEWITATVFDVPVCIMGDLDYRWMLQQAADGEIRVADKWNPAYAAGEMSSFSSWGPTESLSLKPEIAGIGGDVFSAYMYDQFAIMSGTSMASPAVAASAALLRQYLKENELVAEEDLAYVVNCLLMSTATPIYDEEHGTYYFIRCQGAGLANIGAAINSGAYITVEGTNKAKLELGDDPDRTGEYTMEFEVVNFSNTDKTYTLDTTVLGQRAEGGQFRNGKVTYLTVDYAREVDAAVASSLENVTVPANSTAKVTVTVTLSDGEKAYYDERFPAGAYVEGFIQLLSNETPNLVVPFLGFYGDFSDAPILEEGTYETILGGTFGYNTADQFHNSVWAVKNISDYDDVVTKEEHYLGDTSAPGYVKVSPKDYNYESMHAKATEFHSALAGFSPNGDRNLDSFNLGLGLRRNAENIHYTVTNYKTGEVLWEQDTGYVTKTYNSEVYAGGELSLEWLYPVFEFITQEGEIAYDYDKTQCLLENNTWVEITAEVTPEGMTHPTQQKSFTLYIDNDGPLNIEDVKFHVNEYQYSPDQPPFYEYVFESIFDEQWFVDYSLDIGLIYNYNISSWGGIIYKSVYTDTTPLGGQSGYGSASSYPTFSSDFRNIVLAYDYAGNVSSYEVRGGEYLLDYIDLTAKTLEIAVDDTLSITNVANAPIHTVLNWSVSDSAIAEIVETSDGAVTIRGLSRGTVTVYGGFGEYVEGMEITVTDPAFDALWDKFVDVPGHWAEEEILEAVYRGLFEGVDETHFAPNANITRGQLVTVLHRMEGEPEATETAAFTDLKAGAYYEKAVHWAAENGIVKGITADRFEPDAPVTREQFATFLYRYAEYKGLDVSARADLSGYNDAATVGEYAVDAISWAVANGLIKGVTYTTLSPKTTATRAQAATILVRYLTK